MANLILDLSKKLRTLALFANGRVRRFPDVQRSVSIVEPFQVNSKRLIATRMAEKRTLDVNEREPLIMFAANNAGRLPQKIRLM